MSFFTEVKKRLDRAFSDTLVPLISMSSPPEEIARGAFVGMFVGMTPTEGFQTILLTLFWYLARCIRGARFNFKIAFATSMVSNYMTVVPLYFLFYYTGALAGRVFWHWESPVSYGEFSRLLEPLSDLIFPESIMMILDISGSLLAPLFLGCLPYATVLSVVSYHVALRLVSEQGKGVSLKSGEIKKAGT